MIGFILHLCRLAASLSISSAGTTLLGITGTLVYPVADLVRDVSQNGWAAIGEHWRKRLKFSFIIGVVWWSLLFSYQLFYGVPHQINTSAERVRAPRSPVPPYPPAIAWITHETPVKTAAAPREISPPGIGIVVKPIFTNSPMLTAKRREEITRNINSFRDYLLDIGYEVPSQVPPIGVRKTKPRVTGEGTVLMFSSTPDEEQLYVIDTLIDKPDGILEEYGLWIFAHMLNEKVPVQSPWSISTDYVFTLYYVSSFTNVRPDEYAANEFGHWLRALWDIRQRQGKQFTDSVMYYTAKNLDSTKNYDTFDACSGQAFIMDWRSWRMDQTHSQSSDRRRLKY